MPVFRTFPDFQTFFSDASVQKYRKNCIFRKFATISGFFDNAIKLASRRVGLGMSLGFLFSIKLMHCSWKGGFISSSWSCFIILYRAPASGELQGGAICLCLQVPAENPSISQMLIYLFLFIFLLLFCVYVFLCPFVIVYIYLYWFVKRCVLCRVIYKYLIIYYYYYSG